MTGDSCNTAHRRKCFGSRFSAYLDADGFEELRRSVAAYHREDEVVRYCGLLLARARVLQDDLAVSYLLDGSPEVDLYLALVDAVVDLLLVAELEVVLHVGADDERHVVYLGVGAVGYPVAMARGDQVDGGLNRGVARADDDEALALELLGVRQLVHDLVEGPAVAHDLQLFAHDAQLHRHPA